MKVALRVDASLQIGSGHFMRCLTLAEILKSRKVRTCFVYRHALDALKNMAEQRGHQLIHMDAPESGESFHPDNKLDHSHWLGVSQLHDVKSMIRQLAGESWDWIVVDHYALDEVWESEARKLAGRIMVIDDIADRKHDCDVLLDQNLHADMYTRYADKLPYHCKPFLGPRYALLREEFRRLRDRVKPRKGPLRRILVFFGGVDATNCTGLAIQALAELEFNELHVDVVIGSGHPRREQVEVECRARGFQCHVQTDKMADLMVEADIAIGAGGSTSWERCCMGLPGIYVTLADNQESIARSLAVCGAGQLVGRAADLSKASLKEALLSIYHDPSRLEAMSEKAMLLVDGLGASRMADVLCG